jgi:hypothetical protein
VCVLDCLLCVFVDCLLLCVCVCVCVCVYQYPYILIAVNPLFINYLLVNCSGDFFQRMDK